MLEEQCSPVCVQVLSEPGVLVPQPSMGEQQWPLDQQSIFEKLEQVMYDHRTLLHLVDRSPRLRKDGGVRLIFNCQRGPRSSSSKTYMHEHHLRFGKQERQQSRHRCVGCKMRVTLDYPVAPLHDPLSGERMAYIPFQAVQNVASSSAANRHVSDSLDQPVGTSAPQSTAASDILDEADESGQDLHNSYAPSTSQCVTALIQPRHTGHEAGSAEDRTHYPVAQVCCFEFAEHAYSSAPAKGADGLL